MERQTFAAMDAMDAPPEPPPPPTEKPPPSLTPEEVDRVFFGQATDRDALIAQRAWGFFEELAMLGVMRRAEEDEPWWDAAYVEERLLARFDAVVACGEKALPSLLDQLESRPMKDPQLWWGAVFLFGSLEGNDAWEQAVQLVESEDLGDEEMFEALADALRFVPHPRAEPTLREWLLSPDLSRRRLAIRALGQRGALLADEALQALDGADLTLQLEAARVLKHVKDPVGANVVGWLLRQKDERLVEAGLETSLARGIPAGAKWALEQVQAARGAFARTALYAALAGTPPLGQALQKAARDDKSAVWADALGWFGDVNAVEVLLERLRDGEPRAAWALFRITGAPLTDEAPEVDLERGEKWFDHPRPPPEPPEELTLDADVWQAFWKLHGPSARKDRRYRWGGPFRIEDLLWEMRDAPAGPTDRRLAHLELAARTGGTLPFDPSDFAPRQRAQLEAWSHWLSAQPTGKREGEWPTKLR
jgi:hypothetical protein